MNEQQYVIEFGSDGRATVDANDLPWLDDKVRREPGPVSIRLRSDDSDTEGHAMVGTGVRVILEDGDDTEGHALSLNFPTLEEADAFRRRLVLAGVLAGTVAFGAVAGVGLSNLSSGDAGTAGGAAEAASGQYVSENMGGTIVAGEAASGQYVSENMGGTIVAGEAAGSAWTPDERAGLSAATSGSAAGMEWSQAERPGQAEATSGSAAGMEWSQAERPGQATAPADAADDDGANAPGLGGPTPR